MAISMGYVRAFLNCIKTNRIYYLKANSVCVLQIAKCELVFHAYKILMYFKNHPIQKWDALIVNIFIHNGY